MFIRPASVALPVFLAVSSVPAWSEPLFGSQNCAVVVAARPTLPEARAWISENGYHERARVFLSSNNWFAITVGVVAKSASEGIISNGVRRATMPSDTYCTSGSSFLKEINWRTASSGAPSTDLWGDFDARPMSVVEKRFLQGSLALAGYYSGLLDGAWGRGSQSSLEAFTRDKFNEEPSNSHAAALVIDFIVAIDSEGWEQIPMEGLAMNLMMPVKKMRLTESDGLYKQWDHSDLNLQLIANDLINSELVSVHNFAESKSVTPSDIYKVRKRTRWVTSTTDPRGLSVYVRSELIRGTWSTVFITGGSDSSNELNLMVSSISTDTFGSLIPPENSTLMTHAMKLLDEFEESKTEPEPQVGVSQSPSQPEPKSREGGTGTGFLINEDGVLLTNAHVVEECSSINVNGHRADLIVSSNIFDLAAVSVRGVDLGEPLRFASDSVGLNADITIAGYPLHGLLGGLNVSRGSISALKGLRGDETNLQISAPVQPGNSGGPAVNRFGNVVGVVVSKLNTVEIADLTGDIAQNVNFAVRGDLAKVFLMSNGINYTEANRGTEKSVEDLAQMLQSATHLIECAP
ncbi:serine protease [Sulfitobacter sp. R18_1]|uniref:S1C family serine protease n=1 Tax=Sulfitobacter sp. R18_1 TaxID=2821104 RepID=UPI001ADD56A6|nr:serine protease [Sulfitobacter sp. R18_1]MBO9427975.1 trypsin-like peptidase domain-containing protein [Sulfitobacter sp. R18_1]